MDIVFDAIMKDLQSEEEKNGKGSEKDEEANRRPIDC